MISTYHGDETWTVLKRGKQKMKPVCGRLDYNQYMSVVHLKDQLLQSYFVEGSE
jgi:hypothetical protein